MSKGLSRCKTGKRGDANVFEDKNSECPKSGEHMCTVTGILKGKNVLLQTATVMAYNENSKKSVPVSILLDCGSQHSYVTNSLKS